MCLLLGGAALHQNGKKKEKAINDKKIQPLIFLSAAFPIQRAETAALLFSAIFGRERRDPPAAAAWQVGWLAAPRSLHPHPHPPAAGSLVG